MGVTIPADQGSGDVPLLRDMLIVGQRWSCTFVMDRFSEGSGLRLCGHRAAGGGKGGGRC